MRAGWVAAAVAVSLAMLSSCAGSPEGTVSIVLGEEADAFSRAPAPVLLIAEKVDQDGNKTEIARTTLPSDSINLGELPRTEVGGISVKALDPGGKPLLRGESLFVQWGALESQTLEVFVQRTGELARVPRGPAAMDVSNATVLAGRYILAAAGTATMIYDLLGLRPLSTPPTLPRTPKSLGSFGTAALLIDETGATTFDLSNGLTFPLDAPSGGNFAEVAGGQTVGAPDGSQYIVGATRNVGAGGPTPRVLILDPQGKASFAGLTAPREGACATFVEGRGLVVVGGDPTAAGAELLAIGSTLATPLPFPPDPIKGCGLAALDNQRVVIAGGTGGPGDTAGTGVPARLLDLACTTACAPVPWKDPIPLSRAQTFALAPDVAFVLGDDAAGATHAYRATAGELREIPLRLPRRGARLLVTPLGTLAVVGGGPGIEQYLE